MGEMTLLHLSALRRQHVLHLSYNIYRAPPDALVGEEKEGVRKGEVKQRERAEIEGVERKRGHRKRRDWCRLI